ncbi:MAG TPA: Holliday junction branch migration protein RuvA [Acidimicrobiales bacterium]|jgi:Holliday junction DNA helicase RuvA|nr:Holliday junction branch migration protein RuvA [Acidimicrobiales bacterium]
MIGYLRGAVIERRAVTDSAVELVLDVNGVGYRVYVAPRLAAGMAAAGIDGEPVSRSSNGHGRGAGEARLSIHTHVREGAITLYGFADPDERQAFEILLGAHGVGPALALAIVAAYSPGRLVEILASDDVDALTLVPGVGRKTALRLLVDLKARFGELDGARLPAEPGVAGKPTATSEVADALAQLGWAGDDVRSVMRELPSQGTTEELLRVALKELARRR